jgi:hypothetical protein
MTKETGAECAVLLKTNKNEALLRDRLNATGVYK